MTRAGAALALLAAAAGVFALLFTWQAGLASLYDDSVSYLVMAQAMSPFERATDAILEAARREKYPPLFPLLLAWTGGAYDWRIAHAIVALAFAASVYLLGVHVRLTTGSAAMGVAGAAVYALMPGAWLNVKGILTEFPFIALTLAALVWHARFRNARLTRRAAVVLGVLMAATFLLRTVGIALVAGVAAAEALRFAREGDRKRAGHALLAVAIVAIAGGAWYALRPAGGEDAYASYGARMASGTLEHGLAWTLGIAGANLSAMTDAWFNALLVYWGEPWRPAFMLAAALGVAGTMAILWRARDGEADALFVVAMLAILAVWPFPGQMFRLAFPAVPLVWAAFLWAWHRALLRWSPEGGARRAPLVAALPLVLCVPALVFYIGARASTGELPAAAARAGEISEFYRIPSGPAALGNALTQLAVFDDLERIGRTTPEDARVLWYGPAYVALLARRHGALLERPDSVADFVRQVRESRADYLYLGPVHPRDTAQRLGSPMLPVELARPFTQVVWERTGAGGEPRAVLLKIQREKLDNPRPS